ncbi:hypothetical protein BJF78_14120 [Pseudonocardia sp. CNS-139]|nr:hypothetical protein BJF78_14120 [Pseudonocardia sp. CNS-139]
MTFARAFHAATDAVLTPVFEQTRGYDRHRLAEIEHDIAGMPYRPEGDGWARSVAFDAAARVDPVAVRAFRAVAELVADQGGSFPPGLEERIARIAATAPPRYEPGGPSRADVLAAVGVEPGVEPGLSSMSV